MTDTVLRLGSVSFDGNEVPPEIVGGGAQGTAIHRLIGGTRVIDAMGTDPGDIAWSGRLQGQQAEARLRILEGMRDRGEAVSLTWGGQNKQVILKRIDYHWQRFYQILYSITCEVVEDIVASQQAGGLGFETPLADLIGQDTLDALGLSDLIGNATLGSAMSDLQGAVSFAGAITGSSKIAALGGYLNTAQSASLGVFSIANGNVAGGALSLAGVAGRNAGGVMGAQAANMAGLANVSQVRSLLSRVGLNLGQGG